MQKSPVVALNSWKKGGLNVGFDFGCALTLVFVFGLIQGLSVLFKEKIRLERTGTDDKLRINFKHRHGHLNLLQQSIYMACVLLEKILLRPLIFVAEYGVGPTCSYLFASVAFIPGYFKGVKSKTRLLRQEYDWAMQFVNRHGAKVAWGAVGLSVMGFSAGIFLPFVLSTKIALAAYIAAMFFMPMVLSHLFMGVVGGSRGLWFLLAPVLPLSRSAVDRATWAYHGEHKVQTAFQKEPQVAASLNALFLKQTEQLEEYARQQAWLGGQPKKKSTKAGRLLTIVGLQDDQAQFITYLQKFPTAEAKLKAIQTKEGEFDRRLRLA